MARRYCAFLLFLVFALTLSNCASTGKSPSPIAKASPPKHPLDQSEYRRFVLDNGIKVLLVSDPSFNKSAAAVDVAVGSLSDPKNRQGLAHFLEHMLFMGTEKYPQVDDYLTYIEKYGGARNAYTASEHTNYYFEINHEAFDGALDRLSQFFIQPLFTEEFTEREIHAVHSEFQKNLENDGWRKWRVQSSIYRADHPLNSFTIGSLETLEGIGRDELLDFHRTHYSANRMSLALLGKAPLDTLERQARTHFSPVENKDLAPLDYPPNYLDPKPTFRLLSIEPIKDLRSLELEFALPLSLRPHYGSKTLQLLGSLVGHEGKGSLLSLLKAEGLATGLSAGGSAVTHTFGAFSINVNLTPKGLEDYRQVVRHCLAYIALLNQQDYPAAYFDELKRKAHLDELYTNRGEGARYAERLASQARAYPLEVAERVNFIYAQQDPDFYRQILSYLRPDNLLVTLLAKGVPTDSTEHYFGTAYSYAEDSAFYQTLLKLDSHPQLHLPNPNPFMPRQAAVPNRSINPDVVPTKILAEEGVVLYHAQDFEFLRPKISLKYKLRFPADKMDLRFKVLLDTYTDCVKESLNELSYPANLAGLGYSFASGYEGVYFTVGGFDESAPRLFDSVLDHMQNLRLDQTRFEAIKDGIVRNLKNFDKQDAWRLAQFYNGQVYNAKTFHPTERLAIAEGLTLADIQAFAAQLYDRVFIEALAHGNITDQTAIELTRRLQTRLGITPIPEAAAFGQTYLSQPSAESLLRVEQLGVNNSCFWREYYAGAATYKNRAIALILENFLRGPFFTEMRSKQQLGYLAWAGPDVARDNFLLYFIIQSGTHSADVVEDRADEFIATYPAQFRALPADNFAVLKASAAEELKKKAKSIGEKANKFNLQAFDYDGDFARDQNTLAALDKITQEEVAAFLDQALGAETRRMRTTLAFAKEHQAQRQVESSFADLAEWKKSRIYR